MTTTRVPGRPRSIPTEHFDTVLKLYAPGEEYRRIAKQLASTTAAHYRFGTPIRAPELCLAPPLVGRSHQPVSGTCHSRDQSTLPFIICDCSTSRLRKKGKALSRSVWSLDRVSTNFGKRTNCRTFIRQTQ